MKSELYGILGHPVGHTLSPFMHQAAYAALKMRAQYLAFDVPPSQLAEAVRGLLALGVRGANVTLPHKCEVLKAVDHLDASARLVGAANTLAFDRSEGVTGYNTDALGLLRSVCEAGWKVDGAKVLIIGAGGAARAAVYGMLEGGAERVIVGARRPEQALRLQQDFHAFASVRLQACTLESLSAHMQGAGVLVQATDATMDPEAGEQLAQRIDWQALPTSCKVVDVVYTPEHTAVLEKARLRGHAVLGGLGMLIHQGALAFELWTGRTAPVKAMREAAEAHRAAS